MILMPFLIITCIYLKKHTHTIYTYFSREFVETILKSLHLLSPPVLLLNQESFEVIIPNGFANVFFFVINTYKVSQKTL